MFTCRFTGIPTGLVLGAEATTLATSAKEREAGQAMMAPPARPRRTTLGAHKNYDTRALSR